MHKKLYMLLAAMFVWGCVHSKGPPFDDGRIFLIIDEKVESRLIGHEGGMLIVTEVEGYEPFQLFVVDQSMFDNPVWGERFRRAGLDRSNTLDLVAVRGRRLELTRHFLPDGSLSEGILVPGGTEVRIRVLIRFLSPIQELTAELRVDGDALFRLYPAGTEESYPKFILERVL